MELETALGVPDGAEAEEGEVEVEGTHEEVAKGGALEKGEERRRRGVSCESRGDEDGFREVEGKICW